jgi:hypothetical protein
MTKDLSTLFPQPLPCIAIERWTGRDGWPCFRVFVFREGEDHTKEFNEHPDHPSALAAAEALAAELGMEVADLTQDNN